MINVINYVELIDQSLLSILNNSEISNICQNGILYIDWSKQNKELFLFYLNDLLNNKLIYGYNNILINSCEPKNNKRNYTNINLRNKFYIEDETVNIDLVELQDITEKYFNKLKIKNFNFIKLEHENLSIIDIFKVISDLYVTYNKFIYSSYIISDMNLKLFEYDNNIEDYYIQEVKEKIEKRR